MTDPQIAPAGLAQPQAPQPVQPAAAPQAVVAQAVVAQVPLSVAVQAAPPIAAQPVVAVAQPVAPQVPVAVQPAAAPVAAQPVVAVPQPVAPQAPVAVQPVAGPVAVQPVAPVVAAAQPVAPQAPVAVQPAAAAVAVAAPAAVPQAPVAKAPAPAAAPAAAKPAAKAASASKTASTKQAGGKVKIVIAGVSPLKPAEPVTFMDWVNVRVREAPSYLVSIVLHAVVFLLLSIIVIPAKSREEFFDTIVAEVLEQEPPEVKAELDETTMLPEKPENLEVATSQVQVNTDVVSDKPSAIDVDVSDAAPNIEVPDGIGGAGNGPHMAKGELAGRSKKARGAMLASQGGTPASEVAVNTGLKWLARHQKPDGSWSFKHGMDDPGAIDNPTGATGLALLAFLGGGHTHKSGDYEKQVQGGLSFLVSKMSMSGDVRAGADMYTQGICTIALCEAYALSKDKNLRQPTQAAVNFIVNAQDPAGGGWRYQPGQKGDTSVVGWQVMALKSAKIGKLQVPNKTIGKATVFLNHVQAEEGAKYGYDSPGAGPATSAVGLLCRMYLGWTPKNQGLVKGVEYLSKTGPNPGNIYFNYYATQVLHHWGGEPWTKWNNVMREYLVTTQEKSGDAAGSWKPLTGHDDVSGGRHYRTCLSVMTLEVYYRHLPIYQRETIKVEF